jgi:hypothetical protein
MKIHLNPKFCTFFCPNIVVESMEKMEKTVFFCGGGCGKIYRLILVRGFLSGVED